MARHWNANHKAIVAQSLAFVAAIVLLFLEAIDNLAGFEHHVLGQVSEVNDIFSKRCGPVRFFRLPFVAGLCFLGATMTDLTLATMTTGKKFSSFRLRHCSVQWGEKIPALW